MKIAIIILSFAFISSAVTGTYSTVTGVAAENSEACSDLITPSNNLLTCLLIQFGWLIAAGACKMYNILSNDLGPYLRCLAKESDPPIRDFLLGYFNGIIDGANSLSSACSIDFGIWNPAIEKYCPTFIPELNAQITNFGTSPGEGSTKQLPCSNWDEPGNSLISCLMTESSWFYHVFICDLGPLYSSESNAYLRCIASQYSPPVEDFLLSIFNGFINGRDELLSTCNPFMEVYQQNLYKYCPKAVLYFNAFLDDTLSSL